MKTTITSTGNAGFLVVHGNFSILIDPYQGDGSVPVTTLLQCNQLNLILITHGHWDHFDAERVSETAASLGSTIVAPPSVIRKLRQHKTGKASLLDLDPPETPKGKSVPGLATVVSGAKVTAFKTFHGSEHNSYLIELPGLRFFHDGDNEHTGQLDRSLLTGLDALMICPWQGSGWVDFIDSIKPRHWFLMHMSMEELDQHERGEFFPDLCDHVPAGLVALRPGQSMTLSRQEKHK